MFIQFMYAPLTVVAAQLRVRGVEGLRVVAASVLPKQITGNPNGPIIMIVEKAADLILNRPPLPPAEFSMSN